VQSTVAIQNLELERGAKFLSSVRYNLHGPHATRKEGSLGFMFLPICNSPPIFVSAFGSTRVIGKKVRERERKWAEHSFLDIMD
jgi:hypothetical protein